MLVELSKAEIDTLLQAIDDASNEVCYDPDDPGRYPQGYAYAKALAALTAKLQSANG